MRNFINLFNGSHTRGTASGRANTVLSQPLCKSGQDAVPAIHGGLQVTALFADGVLSLNLSNGDTLAELAKRLEQYSRRYLGAPAAIYVKSGIAGKAEFRPSKRGLS
jgi:hypothetical protein